MTSFEWTTRLAVGFPEMDTQHQRLIAMMDQLQIATGAGADATQVLAMVDALGAFAVQHFAEEEQVMASIHFPSLDVHSALHRALLARFADHRPDLAETGRFTPEFSELLFRWLTGHICGPDTKYGVYSGRLTSRV